jgi:hypothetical protein
MNKIFTILLANLVIFGSLASEVRSQSLLQTFIQTNNVGVNIPDPGQYSSSITMNQSLFDQITNVKVSLVLSSPVALQPMWLGQIKASLLYGNNTETQRGVVFLDRLGVTSSDPFGSSATSLNQTFDLGTAFNGGLLASNLWTLTVADMQSGAIARFDSWTLEVSGVPEPSSASLVILGLAAVLAGRRRGAV